MGTAITRECCLITVAALIASPAWGQERDHRRAFGSTRPAVAESLLSVLYPSAHYKWAPDLQVQDTNGSFTHVQFSGLTVNTAPDGSLLGATGIELGKKKERAIFNAKHFQKDDNSKLPTELIVFRTDAGGKISQHRKFELDSADPISEIKIIRMADGSKNGWPNLQIRYVSHISVQDSYTQIEWQALFDSNGGKTIARAPLGIVTTLRNGNELTRMFSIRRVNATQLEITDAISKTAKPYSCGDPCIVDGPTLLAQWSQ